MHLRISVWGIFLFAVCSHADTYLRQPAIDVLHYDISLRLSDDSDSITATTKIHVRICEESVSGMSLDFAGMKLDRVRVHGSQRPFVRQGGNVRFDFGRRYKQNETAIVEIRYHGKPDRGFLIGKNNYGRRVFFTENWPDSAHYWIPSIDHPSDKASMRMTVDSPQRYSVVSNGRMVKTENRPNGRKLTQWEENRTIPTYCIALGVAEFAVEHQSESGSVPIEVYAFPEDSELASRKFRSTSSVLAYFSSLIAPFPYEKLAQVQASVPLGGMENSSAIFYTESSIQNSMRLEELIPHEIAHQWFGDSVTQTDWDELWLSEGFATYFAALFYERQQGRAKLQEIMAEYARKLNTTQLSHERPIIDPEQTDLRKKLNLLNYEKGAWVLHMLRGILGDERFFDGIRHYYQSHEGANATSEDFRRAMEERSRVSLTTFFNQWLNQPGWPVYHIAWSWNEALGEVELSVRQVQATGLFDMPIEIILVGENHTEARKFRIFDEEHIFRIPLSAKPTAVEFDPQGWVLKSLSLIRN